MCPWLLDHLRVKWGHGLNKLITDKLLCSPLKLNHRFFLSEAIRETITRRLHIEEACSSRHGRMGGHVGLLKQLIV